MQHAKIKAYVGLFVLSALVVCMISLFKLSPKGSQSEKITDLPILSEQLSIDDKPKVLFVDSYHEGYAWSEGILKGVLNVFDVQSPEQGKFDSSQSPINLRVVRMDTKRNQSDSFMQQAGADVKEIIDTWRPDVVITSDDNASRYVTVPYYLNSDLPFVFCGINWDASGYGFPCDNVTGMIEVDLVENMLNTMRQYARGPRIGLLGADNVSNRKAAENYVNKLGVKFSETVFVQNLEAMKTAYLDLQGKVDMLILMPPSFLDNDSKAAEAKTFMLENTRIITGSVESWIAPYTLFCFSKSPEELGNWAAFTALEILDGRRPSDIPLTQNQQVIMYLNMPLSNKLNIVFPIDMLEQATIITGKDTH